MLPSLGFILPLVYDGCFIAMARDWECVHVVHAVSDK